MAGTVRTRRPQEAAVDRTAGRTSVPIGRGRRESTLTQWTPSALVRRLSPTLRRRFVSVCTFGSLMQTCIANGIDGYRYLKALLIALPRAKTVEDFEALLPWRIALDPA